MTAEMRIVLMRDVSTHQISRPHSLGANPDAEELEALIHKVPHQADRRFAGRVQRGKKGPHL